MAQPSAYQRVGSQYDVTEAGVPSCSYLFFDGGSDSMATGTITPGIDKAQVFAGVRKSSDAATGVITEFSANINTNAGSFGVFGPLNGGDTHYGSVSRGSASGGFAVSPSSYAAPISSVVAVLGSIPDDTNTLRVNGSQVATLTTDQGTGNYLAYPLYLGGRAGTSLFFNGNLFGLVVRFGANLDASVIASTETWMANKTGVTL